MLSLEKKGPANKLRVVTYKLQPSGFNVFANVKMLFFGISCLAAELEQCLGLTLGPSDGDEILGADVNKSLKDSRQSFIKSSR